MKISRRRVLGTSTAIVSSLVAGCSGGQVTSNQTTSERTTARTTASCTLVDTDFEVPAPSKPAELTTETVETPVARIEKAYEDTLTITPELLPQVPREAKLKQYNLRRANIEKTSAGTFRVKLVGIARYTVIKRNGEYVTVSGENQSEGTTQRSTVVHHDAPIQVAEYRVTPDSISRRAGIGDLTGVLHCW